MVFSSTLLAALLLGQAPGTALPPWTPGTLDLHQIHTGRGNALLMVTPGGGAVLVDAGEVADGPPLELEPRRAPGVAASLAAYLRRFTPNGRVDYTIVTHYHDDHLGAIPALAAELPLGVLIDRGGAPAPPPFPAVQRYLDFRQRYSGPRETFAPGRLNQLRVTPHPGFEIRNLAANGHIWTGRGEQARSAFPANWATLPRPDQPNENHFSIAFRVRYGAFDYFHGADLVGIALDGAPAWHDLETPVARVAGPVDVLALNHHGWLDTTNDFFLHTLAPRVAIIPAWHASHPDHGVLRRLRSPRGPQPDLYITALLPATRAVFPYLASTAFAGANGHIVVRVSPGGADYRVFVLDAATEAALVKTASPVYPSR